MTSHPIVFTCSVNLNDTQQFAWLEFRGLLYWSQHTVSSFAPETAVTTLIQGIYDRFGPDSFRVVRQRIFCWPSATELCREMTRVAAKRLTVADKLITLTDDPVKVSYSHPAQIAEPHVGLLNPTTAMQLTRTLATHGVFEAEKFLSDRGIGAVLVSGDGLCIGTSFNENHSNRTLHAEVKALQGYWRRTKAPLPHGTTLYSSLQPCRMCAAMFAKMSAAPSSLKIIFERPDHGRHGRHNILAIQSRQWAYDQDIFPQYQNASLQNSLLQN